MLVAARKEYEIVSLEIFSRTGQWGAVLTRVALLFEWDSVNTSCTAV